MYWCVMMNELTIYSRIEAVKSELNYANDLYMDMLHKTKKLSVIIHYSFNTLINKYMLSVS